MVLDHVWELLKSNRSNFILQRVFHFIRISQDHFASAWKILCKTVCERLAMFTLRQTQAHFKPTGRHVKCQTLPQANMPRLLLAQMGHCTNCIHMTPGQLKTQTGWDHLCLYNTVRQRSQKVLPAWTMQLQGVFLHCCSVNAYLPQVTE